MFLLVAQLVCFLLGSQYLRDALPCDLFLFGLPNQEVWILHFVCWEQLRPYVRSGLCTSWLSLCPSQLSLLCMCQLDGVCLHLCVWPAAYTEVWAGLAYTASHFQLVLVPRYSLAMLKSVLTLYLVVPVPVTPPLVTSSYDFRGPVQGARCTPPASQLLLFVCSPVPSSTGVHSSFFYISSQLSDSTASFTWTTLSVRHLRREHSSEWRFAWNDPTFHFFFNWWPGV